MPRNQQRKTHRGVWTDTREERRPLPGADSGRKAAPHRKVPPSPFPPSPRRMTDLGDKEAPNTRMRIDVTAVSPPCGEAAVVTGRSQHEGAAVDPAVTKHAHSQSAPGASAGRPLNSARQLPAVWRVHSAMQYVCQRCGTKEQPFCVWAGPAPRCQRLRAAARTNYRAVSYFSIGAPKTERTGGKNVCVFQVSIRLFSGLSKNPDF